MIIFYFKILRIFLLFFFVKELEWNEIKTVFDIIFSIFFLKNNKKNQILISEKINRLGIIPTKLAQWTGYFLKIHFEDYKSLDLLLASLPYLQNQCTSKKPIYFQEYINKFSHIIDSVEEEPIASASIAQIYRGKSKDGKDIVIKIKHDGLIYSIHKWEKIFEKIGSFEKLHINTQHFFENIKEQMDFRKEAENMKLYMKYYRKNCFIEIPEYYGGDENIIIMSYIPSENFQEVKPSLVQSDIDHFTLLSKIMYQDNIFIKDIIHMDLHNGNWGINRINRSIVLYDFGWVLKDQSDFKRFFILTHLGRSASMEFFMKKYNLDDIDGKLQKYTDTVCDTNSLDTLEGLRVILRMFPNEFSMDNFMFCVLSLCVFISSLSNRFEDLEVYLQKEIEFMEENRVFLPLCSLMKNIKNPTTKVQLKKWYNQVENSPNKVEI